MGSIVISHIITLLTKAQISFAVTAMLISAFVFATRLVQSLYFLNTLAVFCYCALQFVSDLFGNHIVVFSMRWLNFVSALGATSEGGSVQAMMAETEQRETTFLDILSKKLKSEGVSTVEHIS